MSGAFTARHEMSRRPPAAVTTPCIGADIVMRGTPTLTTLVDVMGCGAGVVFGDDMTDVTDDEDAFAREHALLIDVRVLGPTTPNPVPRALPPPTTLSAICHFCTAASVKGPKYPVSLPDARKPA